MGVLNEITFWVLFVGLVSLAVSVALHRDIKRKNKPAYIGLLGLFCLLMASAWGLMGTRVLLDKGWLSIQNPVAGGWSFITIAILMAVAAILFFGMAIGKRSARRSDKATPRIPPQSDDVDR